MAILRFHVQGSAKEPYRVSAEGQGTSLRMFCTCPAGDRAGSFCKHAAALLMGEVTNLRDPSASLLELNAAAAGSPLLGMAVRHRPRPVVDEAMLNFLSIDDVLKAYKLQLVAKGWDIDRQVVEGDRATDELHLFEFFNNGKRRKSPSVILFFERTTHDLVVREDGTLVEENVRLRERPWGVRAKQGKSLGSWKALSRAMPTFLEATRLVDGA